MKTKQNPARGFDSPNVVKSMQKIADEIREHTKLKKDSMLIFKAVDENESLDCAVIFAHAGDNTYDEGQRATESCRTEQHVVQSVELPESFDEESVYWNHVYGG